MSPVFDPPSFRTMLPSSSPSGTSSVPREGRASLPIAAMAADSQESPSSPPTVMFHIAAADEDAESAAPGTGARTAAAGPVGGPALPFSGSEASGAAASSPLDLSLGGEDFESAGQGFVPHAQKARQARALTRADTASNLLQEATTTCAGSLTIEMAELAAHESESLSKLHAPQLRARAESDALVRRESRVRGAAHDAIWLLEPLELQHKFPQSRIDFGNCKQSKGLTSAEAAELLARFGPNLLTPPTTVPEWKKILRQFSDPMAILLMLAGTLSLAVAYPLDRSQPLNLYLGIVLFFVVFFNAFYAYTQEGKASDVMKSFSKMLSPAANVIRDGARVSVPATDIVPGDLLVVAGGDVIAADMRVLYTQDCKVETSSLTGESLPLTCALAAGPGVVKIEQARNVCFNTSKCLEGEAIGVVFATGDRSLIGTIASMAGGENTEPSTLQREMQAFVNRIGLIATVLATIFFVVAGARTGEWLESFINVFIVVLVALVPQGLPLTVISQLVVTSKKMAEKHVLVKELRSVETLGSVTVIATDKTGTLTMNVMTVSNAWFDRAAFGAASIFANYSARELRKRAGSVASCAAEAKSASEASVSSAHQVLHAPGDALIGTPLPSSLSMLEMISVLCSKARFADEIAYTAEHAEKMIQLQALQSNAQSGSSLSVRSSSALASLLHVESGKTKLESRLQLLTSLSSSFKDDAKREVVGDASETALFNFVKQRRKIELVRYQYPVVYFQPFNSRTKVAIAVVRARLESSSSSHNSDAEPFHSHSFGPLGVDTDGSCRMLLVKGAPEILMGRCSYFADRGAVRAMTDEFRQEYERTYRSFGSRGERVLGFACLPLSKHAFPPSFDTQYAAKGAEALPSQGLVFVGLLSLVDPPKPSVPKAVLACHTAGVKVIMVTGDHPLTAAAIARQVHIFEDGCLSRDEVADLNGCDMDEVDDAKVDCVVVSGTDLDSFTDADWLHTLSKRNIVFARTTPVQKLQIVERLQAQGHIVAVTGDGVNDAPALKRANIGCAMGISGSDVARDAADVVIFDDDFASIVLGIKMGRSIFDNLTKTIAFTMTHIGPELYPVLVAIALNIPPAISSLMILSIDLFLDLAPAVALAYEPPESNIMSKPPRNAKTDRLADLRVLSYCFLQAGLIQSLSGFLAFFLVFRYYGVSAARLFDTRYFQSTDTPDMPVFTGCLTLDSPDSLPYPVDNVCYNETDQLEVLHQAQTAYYAMVVLAQSVHIFLVKTRLESSWSHGLFRNELTIPAVIIQICLLLLFILPPSSKDIIFTSAFPARFWALLVIAPIALIIWQEGRKAYVRRYPHGVVARYVHW